MTAAGEAFVYTDDPYERNAATEAVNRSLRNALKQKQHQNLRKPVLTPTSPFARVNLRRRATCSPLPAGYTRCLSVPREVWVRRIKLTIENRRISGVSQVVVRQKVVIIVPKVITCRHVIVLLLIGPRRLIQRMLPFSEVQFRVSLVTHAILVEVGVPEKSTVSNGIRVSDWRDAVELTR